ncbi:hypothetical protein C8Q74DRAFT_1205932 [Fomes fomentarius]|nr:hypothetical protein C8Q74DRAFT_1205932 [Fomes fomentarius]
MAITPKPEPTDPVLPSVLAAGIPPTKSASELKKEKDAAVKVLSEHRRAIAWPIGRWPVEKRVVYTRTRVHLPRTYLARHGSDVRAIYPGTDINQFVHRHYCEEEADGRKGKEKEAWPNYVAAERILSRRHEYLGPDPRVVGYFVDADGEYHVRWYDTFLGDQWMDSRKWAFDVRQDDAGRWVDVDE